MRSRVVPRVPRSGALSEVRDAELVVSARQGDAAAQEALYRRHAGLAFGLAHRVLAGRGEVDDLVQDAFVFAFSKLETLNNPQAFASWLASIVVRTASKRLRRRRLLVRLGMLQPEPLDWAQLISDDAPPDVRAELRAVYSMVEALPAEERVALVLRRIEGLELTDIAEQMGLSLATVKRRLAAADARIQRARKR